MNREHFIKTNLANKLKMEILQDEHKRILEIIYKDAEKNQIVKSFSFTGTNRSQVIKYGEIKKEFATNGSRDIDVILMVCLNDLKMLGLVYESQHSWNTETGYAICYLGLEYLKSQVN